MEAQDAATACWFQLLAAKGVKELVFMNRIKKFGTDAHLPATLFRCISLTKLYLGFWCFPETATLPPSAAFPYLRGVGLCSLVMKPQDLAFLLDRCPVLEKLVMNGCRWPVCLHFQTRSLRCVQMCSSIVTEITVVHASLLERLLLWDAWGDGGRVHMSSKIKIGHVPKLRFLGFLVPGMHQLEIGNAAIKVHCFLCQLFLSSGHMVGTKASPSTIVPSVQGLAVQVNFKPEQISIGPQSGGTGKVNLKSWEEAGPIECIQRHIKKLVLREFQGKKAELNFLKFIAERAQVLQKMEIVLTAGNSPSDQVGTKLRTFMASAKWANGCCELMISKHQGTGWCYKRAFDLSNQDPFDVSKCREGECM
ncbi:hypothetical protein QOZ80_2BG0185280 [Eleusine coracana subsp. coracana]|nr:hypothetical protein QOZ80_2BG0185280 [Eleusine coracana subsp. coracana]